MYLHVRRCMYRSKLRATYLQTDMLDEVSTHLHVGRYIYRPMRSIDGRENKTERVCVRLIVSTAGLLYNSKLKFINALLICFLHIFYEPVEQTEWLTDGYINIVKAIQQDMWIDSDVRVDIKITRVMLLTAVTVVTGNWGVGMQGARGRMCWAHYPRL